MKQLIRLWALLLATLLAVAPAWAGVPAQATMTSPLSTRLPAPKGEMFSLAATRPSDGTLALTWRAAPGNYLYRQSLTASLDGRARDLSLPPGETKDDPNFGRVEIYHGTVVGHLDGLPTAGKLVLGYQGCAEQGICYPPVRESLDLATLELSPVALGLGGEADEPVAEASSPPAEDGATSVLSGYLLPMAAAFLGFGLLLSLTPCVFPMIPILAAVLAGAGTRLTPGRGLTLSASYVLAMACAYGAVGLAAGWSGADLQALLQTPLALSLAAAVFAALALAMFGAFEMALPAALAERLAQMGRGGSIGGAAVLGFGSALIVGPCVTPPLAAALLYAVRSGQALRGAVALFCLGLGMGLPLMAVGLFGPRILPRSGAWLAGIRRAFGWVFLGVAALLLGRVLPPPAALALWGGLAILFAAFIGGFDRIDSATGWPQRLAKGSGLIAAVCGVALLLGAASGSCDPTRPLAFLGASFFPAMAPPSGKAPVSSSAAFDAAFATAARQGRPVLVSFTAGWCTTCRSNEATLREPGIARRLAALPVLTADITAQTPAVRALMARFSVVGPPTLFLLDPQGHEIPGSRMIGPLTDAAIARWVAVAGT